MVCNFQEDCKEEKANYMKLMVFYRKLVCLKRLGLLDCERKIGLRYEGGLIYSGSKEVQGRFNKIVKEKQVELMKVNLKR
jgi:hypothetical protein